ncbi:hypothetical protein DPMN_127019 [Dreissena polymorpha]|uniref:Uncharacterized protein n=1 Tax=Dreissena polymorpha TaxID=45954 RepID=A0A9D4H154_DREPO|nr:hypothetical protein DPMN_127019 [Dreissena polymorpha]
MAAAVMVPISHLLQVYVTICLKFNIDTRRSSTQWSNCRWKRRENCSTSQAWCLPSDDRHCNYPPAGVEEPRCYPESRRGASACPAYPPGQDSCSAG